jgi:acetyl-CoA C-acetyltransferase
MSEAYIVGAVRTPVGRRRGALSEVHPVDLGAHVIRHLIERSQVNPAEIDDVIFGCVNQVGAQAFNIARTAALSAGLPESVPGVTLDRQCGSSQQAVHFAAQAVRSGDQDLVIAGGVEVMSLIPIGSSATVGVQAGYGHPRGGDGWTARYGDQEISQFRGAEMIAAQWDVNRQDMERFAVESHRRALAAIANGDFEDEIAPFRDIRVDEGPRGDTSLERMAGLAPIIPGGLMTAAVASQISDGAAALMIASENAVHRHNLAPLAKIRATAVIGCDPVTMLSGPIPATEKILERSGMSINEIGLFEVNEAFAPIVLAWLKGTGASYELTNRFGGAIALGHPLGATGARLMTTMVHAMRRYDIRYGLQTMCEGGGMANATIIERT